MAVLPVICLKAEAGPLSNWWLSSIKVVHSPLYVVSLEYESLKFEFNHSQRFSQISWRRFLIFNIYTSLSFHWDRFISAAIRMQIVPVRPATDQVKFTSIEGASYVSIADLGEGRGRLTPGRAALKSARGFIRSVHSSTTLAISHLCQSCHFSPHHSATILSLHFLSLQSSHDGFSAAGRACGWF